MNMLVKGFIIVSAIGFWYVLLPSHLQALLGTMIIALPIWFVIFVVMERIMAYIVTRLRKKYKWAKRLFIPIK